MSLSEVSLVLGPVTFAGFEIPETILYGGSQRLAVHDMPGGQRVVDALGPVPREITWSGIFGGTDATSRARLLDVLRAQGQCLSLSWDIFFYTVLIAEFAADYHNKAWVPYHLRLTVVQDNALSALPTEDNLAVDALSDCTSAATFALQGGSSLASLQTAFTAPNATLLGTAAYVAASASLGQSQLSIQSGLAAQNGTLGAYAENGVEGAAAVGDMITSAGNVAALQWSSAFLGRLRTNMTNAGT